MNAQLPDTEAKPWQYVYRNILSLSEQAAIVQPKDESLL